MGFTFFYPTNINFGTLSLCRGANVMEPVERQEGSLHWTCVMVSTQPAAKDHGATRSPPFCPPQVRREENGNDVKPAG